MENMKCENELVERIERYTILPERIFEGNEENFELSQKLGNFLVQNGIVQNLVEDDEVFKYDSDKRTIHINRYKVTEEEWRRDFFRQQSDSQPLFPMLPMYTEKKEGDEITKYLFLRAMVSAYLQFDQNEPALEDLLQFCYTKREQTGKGLSLLSSLEKDFSKQTFADTNELVTMYIWHPQYCNTYIDYLANPLMGSHSKKFLSKLEADEIEILKSLLEQYVLSIKENVGLVSEPLLPVHE